jgi:FkbM family methyltransferase
LFESSVEQICTNLVSHLCYAPQDARPTLVLVGIAVAGHCCCGALLSSGVDGSRILIAAIRNESVPLRPDSLRRLTWRLGRRLYVSARNEQHSYDITQNGEAEIQQRVIAAVPSSTKLQMIDIGANEAAWTLSALRQVPSERIAAGLMHIDAFEPVPATARRFAAAVATVPGGNLVHLHQAAMSDTAGTTQMAVMSATGGTNTLHYDGSADAPQGGWVDVELDTLTAFCSRENIAHIHLAKCDTEGHDFKVLTGARELLQAERIDVFQFEYNHRWVFSRTYLKDVFDLVVDLPYQIARVNPGRIEVFKTWHPELERFFESNYVLVRQPAMAWFTARQGSFDSANTYA